jgi:hypothetical protein
MIWMEMILLQLNRVNIIYNINDINIIKRINNSF